MALAGALNNRRSGFSRLFEAYGQEFVVLGAIVALFIIAIMVLGQLFIF